MKAYQESHKALRDLNEMIVQASHETGGAMVWKCTEIVFERGNMVRGEGLQVLHERMKAMNPDQNEIYKFLGVVQADGIKKSQGSLCQSKRLGHKKIGDINKDGAE